LGFLHILDRLSVIVTLQVTKVFPYNVKARCFFSELAEIVCYLYLESQEDASGKCTRPNINNLRVNLVSCSVFFRRIFLLDKEPLIALLVCVINLTTFHKPRLDTPVPTSNGSFYFVKYKVLLSTCVPSIRRGDDSYETVRHRYKSKQTGQD